MNRLDFASEFQAVQRRLWLIAAACIGDRTEADDIVQEAAIVAFRKRHEFQVDTNFLAWLSRIVRHCASNHNRKFAGRKTFATDPGSLDRVAKKTAAAAKPDGDDRWDAEQLGLDDELMRALDQLSEVARCCLLLRVIDGASYVEISECVGIPEGTAMSHVHRSKKLIRERWRKPMSPEGGAR